MSASDNADASSGCELQRRDRLGGRHLYSVRAWRDWLVYKAGGLKRAHTRFNVDSIAPHIAPGARVIDIGAWDNRVGEQLHERLGCEVVGVDVVDKNATELPFRCFDGRTLPLQPGERFDVATLLYVLHHSRDDLALLTEAKRAVGPGGRVLVAEDMVEHLGQRALTIGFHLWLLTFTGMGWRGRFRRLESWHARFAEAGLEVESSHVLGPHMGRPLWPRNVLFVLRA